MFLTPILTTVALFTISTNAPVANFSIQMQKQPAVQQTINVEKLQPTVKDWQLQPAAELYQIQPQTGGNGQDFELQPALGYNAIQ